MLTYSKRITIYKLKVGKRSIKTYLQFISTNNNTLQSYLQVKSFTFKICSKKGFDALKKIINNKAKIMPESQLVKNSEQKSQRLFD